MTRFLSQFLSFVLLSFQSLSGIGGYLSLMLLGIVTNTVAAFSLKKIPCRETVEYRKGQNIFRIFYRSIRDRERALTLFVRWQTLSLMVILGFVIPFLKKLAQFPSSLIFLFTLTGTVAVILAGHALRPFTDRIGSRPVLIMASFLLALLSLGWAFISPDSPKWHFFLLGFVTVSLQGTLHMLSSRLELRSIPEQNKIGYASMLNFFSALISLGIGLFGGFLADLGEGLFFPGLNPFGLTFFMAAIISMQTGILSFFLKDAGSLSVWDTAQILFSTRNLKAFLDVHQFHLTNDINRRKAIMLSIGKTNAGVAVDEMRKILQNPLSIEKGEILKSLFAYPNPVLLPDIIREASDEHSYQRDIAIFALGSYPDERVEALLSSLLDHPSSTIRSTAAKSLARIGNTSTLTKITGLAEQPGLGLPDRMNYLIALSIMDKEGRYLGRLFEIVAMYHDSSHEQAMFALTAKMLDMQPPLSELYQEENLQKGSGLQILLEETKPLKPFCENSRNILRHYQQQEYPQVWEWCRKQLAAHESDAAFVYLKQAIADSDLAHANANNSLSVLYFSYQILS